MILQDKNVVYVTREIERALGMLPSKNYIIVSNATPYGQSIKKQYPDFVTLIENSAGKLLGTTELLGHSATKLLLSKIQASSEASVFVFKNTLRVENAATANGWKLLNPASSLSERVENKLSQIDWLAELGRTYLPPHSIQTAKNILWENKPFIIQWAHGHTGDGTTLVRSREELSAWQEKFPERMARVTKYVSGPSFTVNAVVTADKILTGNISYQITGIQPFTDGEFSTIGNDWGAAQSLLDQSEAAFIWKMAQEIGTKLQKDGWRGLFGIDVIRDDTQKKIYLIEVNARQPASTTFESLLQEEVRGTDANGSGITTFEAHLQALLGLFVTEDLIQISDGAQIVQRVTKNIHGVSDDIRNSLESAGYRVVAYQNTDYNSDLLRIQSPHAIMEAHGIFNAHGKEIEEMVAGSRPQI